MASFSIVGKNIAGIERPPIRALERAAGWRVQILGDRGKMLRDRQPAMSGESSLAKIQKNAEQTQLRQQSYETKADLAHKNEPKKEPSQCQRRFVGRIHKEVAKTFRLMYSMAGKRRSKQAAASGQRQASCFGGVG